MQLDIQRLKNHLSA